MLEELDRLHEECASLHEDAQVECLHDTQEQHDERIRSAYYLDYCTCS